MTLLQKGDLATEGTEFLNFFLLFSLCAYYPVGCGRTGFCSGLTNNKPSIQPNPLLNK